MVKKCRSDKAIPLLATSNTFTGPFKWNPDSPRSTRPVWSDSDLFSAHLMTADCHWPCCSAPGPPPTVPTLGPRGFLILPARISFISGSFSLLRFQIQCHLFKETFQVCSIQSRSSYHCPSRHPVYSEYESLSVIYIIYMLPFYSVSSSLKCKLQEGRDLVYAS